MLEKLSTITNKRYRPSLLVLLTILFFGAWSFTSLLDREGFPPIDVPFVTVNGVYFVDDATEVDTDVTQPLADAIAELDEVKRVQSVSRDDSFSLFAELSDTVTAQEGSDLVDDQLAEIKSELPDALEYEVAPISATLFNNQFEALISVYASNDTPHADLLRAAEDLVAQLDANPAIKRAQVEEQVTESINPQTGETEQRQTSFSLYGENTNGSIESSDAIIVGVVGENNTDDLQLDDAMTAVIDRWQVDYEDTIAVVSAGYAETIRTQIGSLQSNVLTGLAVVILVVGLLIGWRASLIVAFFIPTVLAVTLLGILATGNTLNTIVLFGLVLILGLIVDNAIVMTEAIDRSKNRRRLKATNDKIITEAVGKVGLAMAAGTLTTVLVFTPILFVSGVLGEFIRILPTTVVIALLSSLVIAFVFIPFFASGLLLRSKKERKPLLDPLLERGSALAVALPNKLHNMKKRMRRISLLLAVIVGFGIIGLGVTAIGQLAFNIFPDSKDADELIIDITFASDSTLDDARETAIQVSEIISDELGADGQVISYPQASANSALARITLVPFTERTITSPEYIQRLDNRLSADTDIEFSILQLDAGPPADAFPFSVQIFDENVSKSSKLANDLAEFLETSEITRNDGSVIEIDEVRVQSDENIIRRIDGERLVQVSASFEADDITGLVTATQTAVEDEFTTERLGSAGLAEDALRFDFGQESENIESFASVQIALVIAVLLMYFLLVMQFNSFSQPLLILLAVPFSLIGVGLGLSVADHSLSFFVMVGLIGLTGIVVNNAILLVDFANQSRKKGASIDRAIVDAVKQRFRPIVTTTLTTIGALSPLALTDPFWEPLAITVIFGLVASSIMVLSVFPYFYILFEQARAYKNKKLPRLQ